MIGRRAPKWGGRSTSDRVMSMTMTKEELGTFYDKLAELTEHGTEADMRAYINDQYPRLPEAVRDEILFSTLLSSVQDELVEGPALSRVRQEGLAAAKQLEELKAEIEKEGLTE